LLADAPQIKSVTAVLELARRLSTERPWGGVIFFDSGPAPGPRGQWSVLCAYPDEVLIGDDNGYRLLSTSTAVDDPVGWIKASQSRKSSHPVRSMEAPFQGGVAGLLGFELGFDLDDLRCPPHSTGTPRLWIGSYPAALVFCHRTQQWHVVGDEDCEAFARFDAMVRSLPKVTAASGTRGRAPHRVDDRSADPASLMTIAQADYERAVKAGIEAIGLGELFEINYTARFEAPWVGSGFELFEALRDQSTGNYGGFVQADDFFIASISPEQFLEVRDGRVVTRPIKGTRRRDADPRRDAALGDELLRSEKDRAENVMIVDLMRNDLTRFCQPGSVSVTGLCELESFTGVHHLVSTVEGRLDDRHDGLDALLASFPAGSITGAPKLRSIELITELEVDGRGPYTGSMFYWSSCGCLDSNVLIRTATLHKGHASYGAGGAVVADSIPRDEYEEALVKARPFAAAIASGRTEP
jgi:para-aminobenzoate synthetase component I